MKKLEKIIYMIKVSIVVPIYNSEKYILKCIECLVNQTYRQIEIILIDDGSKDNSLQICRECASKDDRIKVVTKNNEGVSATRNMGIQLATGDYITFLDSDDTLDINYIKELVENIDKDCLVRCNTSIINEKIVEQERYIKQIVNGSVQGVCWGYLFKKELIENIKFDTNTSYMEDTIFITKVLLKINQVKIVTGAIYNHNLNQGSLTQSATNIEKRLNGYIYSLDKISEILKENNIFYDSELELRKLKLIETEFSKITNRELICELLNNVNIKQVIEKCNPSLKYKWFMHLMKKQNVKGIMRYIKIRNKIKKLVKGV